MRFFFCEFIDFSFYFISNRYTPYGIQLWWINDGTSKKVSLFIIQISYIIFKKVFILSALYCYIIFKKDLFRDWLNYCIQRKKNSKISKLEIMINYAILLRIKNCHVSKKRKRISVWSLLNIVWLEFKWQIQWIRYYSYLPQLVHQCKLITWLKVWTIRSKKIKIQVASSKRGLGGLHKVIANGKGQEK